MGYKIAYGRMIKRTALRRRASLRQHTLTAGCFLLFLLAAHLIWPDRLALLRNILLPQSSAVMTMVENLQNGEAFPQAVEAFCQQVLGNE